MTRAQRNYSILLVGFILISSLTFFNYHQDSALPFSLLFLPLIVLAGYWEETVGALIITIAAALAMVTLHLFDFIEPTNAMISVLVFGMAFALIALINYDRDKEIKERQKIIEPKELELTAVKHKTVIIREQIERYERRLKGLIKLYEISKDLGTQMELQPMLDEARLKIVRIMQQHFKSASVETSHLAIYVPAEDAKGFTRIGSRGIEVSDEGFPEQISGQELKTWLGEDFNAVRINDVLLEERYQGFVRLVTFRSLMAIPLLMKDIVIGIIMMAANYPDAYSVNDFNTLEVLSKQIVLAVRRSLLYRQVQKLSFTDSQTGLYVHRYFQERLYEEIIRANRYKQPLSLMMLDLDHFKSINDKFGHQIGDAVLVESAKRIKAAAGQTAFVARYGGEEFSVVLPNCGIEEAYKIAAVINQTMKATPVEAEERKMTITISIGLSSFPESARDQNSLLKNADAALYQAKRAGRDCVVKFLDNT